MEKLTKKEAMELTIEMWKWLTETGSSKSQYPKLKDRLGYIPDSYCFLCEVASRECDECPMVWKFKTTKSYTQYRCSDSYTFYYEWRNISKPFERIRRKKYAKLFLNNLIEVYIKEYKEE